MPIVLKFLLFILVYWLSELVYFKLARRYRIIDIPTKRGSHDYFTIRGGGIIFPLACVAGLLLAAPEDYIYLLVGTIVISTISFLDDVKDTGVGIRLIMHTMAIGCMLYVLRGGLTIPITLLLLIAVVGIINGYNFMDGINGITVLNAMVTILTLWWANNVVTLLPQFFFVSLVSSFLVFSWYNLRRRALCFAGDVGSVSVAFILSFLVLKLWLATGFIQWGLLFGVYGLDVCTTIFCRFIRGERLTQAHRSHFYQFLVNEKRLSHITVSIIYATVQLALNIAIIYSFLVHQPIIANAVLLAIVVIYVIFRFHLEGVKRLFRSY